MLEEFGKGAAPEEITSVRDPYFELAYSMVNESLASDGPLRGEGTGRGRAASAFARCRNGAPTSGAAQGHCLAAGGAAGQEVLPDAAVPHPQAPCSGSGTATAPGPATPAQTSGRATPPTRQAFKPPACSAIHMRAVAFRAAQRAPQRACRLPAS